MPWYEPALRAPPTPHRNGNDNDRSEWNEEGNNGGGDGRNHRQVEDVHNYLDESWNYPSYDPSSNVHHHDRRDCLNFDGFQHQVESQLASVFPLADFSSSHSAQNNFFSRQSSSLHHHESTDFSMSHGSNALEGGGDQYSQNQNDHPNLKTNEEGSNNSTAVVRGASKTAQFFHPRPVMTLKPYGDFFSPLQFPNEGAEVAERTLDNNELRGNNGNNSHLSQQDTFYSQVPHQDNFQHEQPQTPTERGSCNLAQIFEQSQEIRPTSNLKPKNLFDNLPSKNPFKQPPKQAKLVQDSKTGQVMAESNSSPLRPGEQTNAKTWDDYGGRPVEEGGKEEETTKEKSKEKKKDKKKKSKKSKDKKQPKQSESDIGAFLNKGKKRSSNDSQENNEAIVGKRKSTSRSKKQKQNRPLHNSGTELDIPSYDVVDDAKPEENDSPTISETDFAGIEQMNLQNAAQCMEGLQQFLTLVGRQKHVAFSMLFLDPYTGNYTTAASSGDGGGGGGKKKKAARSNKYTQLSGSQGFECTTSFLPTSKKYCTAKGNQCTAWNCTCDDQIRAMRGSARLLGAMFVFQDSVDGGDDAGGSGGGGGEWECFLLPLGPTKDSSSADQEVEYSRMFTWPVIPFQCDVSMTDRWKAFEALLLNNSTKLVTYNATVSLLPFYHHLAIDVASRNHSGGLASSQFSACLAGASLDTQSLSNLPVFSNEGYLRSVWDLRLVSWMLRPHATDNELEFGTIHEGFAHLDPAHQQAPSSDMPILMQGLAEAKNNLEFIHSLYPIMNEQLVDGGLLDALECIEAPVQSILASMESRGIGFKAHRLKSKEIEDRIEELETLSRSITKDSDFLLSSPQQVSAFLFDVLKLTIPVGLISKTKAGSSHRSTSEESLKAIKAEITSRTGSSPQIIDIILEFRTLNKLLTTYIRPLPKVCRRAKTTGKRSKNALARIYPQWMQTAVRTGRLSCRKPNLQQVPNVGACGVNPREAFVTAEGMCLFACDYSQKEVRILAHMSGDEALLSLFRGDPNIDIYKQMSSLIRNKPVDAITPIERAQFKQVTLALLYGMSANQVSKKLSISKANAQQMMNDFFRRFRRVKSWMDETKAYARRKSYVKTIAGRKRYLDDINSDDNAKKSQAERQAINTVIQGSAADLMKSAMINMAQNLMRWRDDADPNGTRTRPRMLLQIHDEVILEVRLNKRDITRLQAIAQKSCCEDCEDVFGLNVPLLLKCSAGLSWGGMTELPQQK